jgi:DNA-binding GntR family transcriptional regulator
MDAPLPLPAADPHAPVSLPAFPQTPPTPAPFTLSRLNLTEQVLSELRRRLLHGEIAPGLPLLESRLAQALGVSRVPVREALIALEHEGLLLPGPRNTLVARPLDETDWRQITAVRLQLEPLAAQSAAQRHAPADLAAMRQNIAEFQQASSPEDLARLDVEFHALLCRCARQPWLNAAWQTLRAPFEALLVRNFREYVAATSLAHSKASTADHTGIVDALESADPDTAARLLIQHINRWQEWSFPASQPQRS